MPGSCITGGSNIFSFSSSFILALEINSFSSIVNLSSRLQRISLMPRQRLIYVGMSLPLVQYCMRTLFVVNFLLPTIVFNIWELDNKPPPFHSSFVIGIEAFVAI
jgi:hypothetical protein